MASNFSNRMVPETLRTVNFAAITGTSYVGIGSALANPSHFMYIVNTTNQLLIFSLDGVNDHFVIAANSFFLPDIMTNRSDNGGSFYVAQGTRFYVRAPSVDPISGDVYLSTFYGFQND